MDSVCLLRQRWETDWPAWKKAAYTAWRALLLLCAGACLGFLLLVFA